MTEAALAPTPAQQRMAAARAARGQKLAEVQAESALSLAPDVVALAVAQKAERDAAELAEARRQADQQIASEVGAPVGPSARARAAAAAQAEDAAKYDRARAMSSAVAESGVKVRVTKIGHNKVHKGIHVPSVGDVYYAWKDEPSFPLSIAQGLEDRGLVEILDA